MNFKWNQPKRRHKRYDVSWRALLEIDSPEFNDFMLVPIINLSRSGALVYSPQIYIHNYHLYAAAQSDELNLIIHSPVSELDSKVQIKHYNWDDATQGFHIGVEFKAICAKNQDVIDEIIKGIRHHTPKESSCQESQAVYSFR